MALEFTLPTALILIDNQSGFSDPKTISHWGGTRSNPNYETNLQALLSAFRVARSSSSTLLEVIHVFHSSTTPESPFHPSNPGQGIRPLDFATPASDGSEPVFWKSVNSSFIGTGLEAHLRGKGFRQLIIAGLTTDHCVSTTVRMAANLGVVDRYLGDGPVRLRLDGTHENDPEVNKGRIVSVASLDGEFADVFATKEVTEALSKIQS
ncbi:unnamed protein product [Penicillium viridicatum]